MQKIIPHLWFDTQALEAVKLYVSLFEDSKIFNTGVLYDTPSGDAQTVNFRLAGFEFAAISAGPYFAFNSSISLMVACETKDEVNRLYKTLVEGGSELMPLGTYDFSEWYAWISDRYGLNWQIMLVENINEYKRIRPCLLFSMEVCGKTQDAMDYYSSVFSDSKVGYVNRYLEGQAADHRAKINYAELELFNLEMVMMDHGYGGEATFNEAISFMIQCDDQKEIDYYWEKLSFVPEAEACGWVKDQFGLSWQVIPKMMYELLSNGSDEELERVTKAFLKMKKIDIAALKNMKELQFSIEINASKERVWATLWEDETFRDWASTIDEGTYMKGVMKEGNEIQFISSVNGYGVTSLIEKLSPNEFVLFRHSADTKENGQQERKREWTGGKESYSLAEKDGVTILIVKIDVPKEQEETFNIRVPRALERIKTLAE